MGPLVPCLWFDDNAEDAVDFYLSIFPDSKITDITRYPASGHPAHAGREGTVLTISFTLHGQEYMALNGGPPFQFTEAVSFQILCEDQAETDYYWEKLGAGGDPDAQQCGWLKDRYGLSWQIIPKRFFALLQHPDKATRTKAFHAIQDMKKLDLAAVEAAIK